MFVFNTADHLPRFVPFYLWGFLCCRRQGHASRLDSFCGVTSLRRYGQNGETAQ